MLGLSYLLGRDAIPLAAAYAALLVVLYAERKPPGARVRRDRGRHHAPFRRLASTVVGGYAVFLLLVAVFHVLIAGSPLGELAEAALGGSILAFAVVPPLFLLASWGEEWFRRR